MKLLSNPLPTTPEVIARGKKEFLIYCSPCHGNYAQGDSRLKGQFPNPPTLHSDKVRNWPDANIYNVITNGQNVMPPYAKSISRNDRWAIIHYLRVLQRAMNAPDSDLVSASDTTKTLTLSRLIRNAPLLVVCDDYRAGLCLLNGLFLNLKSSSKPSNTALSRLYGSFLK